MWKRLKISEQCWKQCYSIATETDLAELNVAELANRREDTWLLK